MQSSHERLIAVVKGTGRRYLTNPTETTDHKKLEAELTLQDPVDVSMVSQRLQVHSNGCQVDFVLLQGLAAAAVQLDGPLR